VLFLRVRIIAAFVCIGIGMDASFAQTNSPGSMRNVLSVFSPNRTHVSSNESQNNGATATSHHRLARMHVDRNDIEQAHHHFRLAINSATPRQVPDIAVDYAAFLSDNGDLHRAENMLRQALSKAPNDKAIIGMLARCLVLQGRVPEGLRHFRSIGSEAEAQAEIAAIFRSQGNTEMLAVAQRRWGPADVAVPDAVPDTVRSEPVLIAAAPAPPTAASPPVLLPAPPVAPAAPARLPLTPPPTLPSASSAPLALVPPATLPPVSPAPPVPVAPALRMAPIARAMIVPIPDVVASIAPNTEQTLPPIARSDSFDSDAHTSVSMLVSDPQPATVVANVPPSASASLLPRLPAPLIAAVPIAVNPAAESTVSAAETTVPTELHSNPVRLTTASIPVILKTRTVP